MHRLHMSNVEWPGRAGELQRGGTEAELRRELAADYPRYHAFLRTRLAALGDPYDRTGGMEAFARRASEHQSLLMAELALRDAIGRGRVDHPVFDDDGGLVDVTRPAPALRRRLVAPTPPGLSR